MVWMGSGRSCGSGLSDPKIRSARILLFWIRCGWFIFFRPPSSPCVRPSAIGDICYARFMFNDCSLRWEFTSTPPPPPTPCGANTGASFQRPFCKSKDGGLWLVIAPQGKTPPPSTTTTTGTREQTGSTFHSLFPPQLPRTPWASFVLRTVSPNRYNLHIPSQSAQ